TGAAVLAATDRRELVGALERKAGELVRAGRRWLAQREQRLDMATRLLRPPSGSQARRAHRLRELARSLANRQALQLSLAVTRFQRVQARLAPPPASAAAARAQWLAGRLGRAGAQSLAEGARKAAALAAHLE